MLSFPIAPSKIVVVLAFSQKMLIKNWPSQCLEELGSGTDSISRMLCFVLFPLKTYSEQFGQATSKTIGTLRPNSQHHAKGKREGLANSRSFVARQDKPLTS